jgi:hypothetical protein
VEVGEIGTEEAAAQETQPAETLNGDTMRALAQALEEAQAAGEPVDALVEAVGNGEVIEAENIGDEATGRVLVITAKPECIEATVQPESDVRAKKPVGKGRGKGKKCAAATGSADK